MITLNRNAGRVRYVLALFSDVSAVNKNHFLLRHAFRLRFLLNRATIFIFTAVHLSEYFFIISSTLILDFLNRKEINKGELSFSFVMQYIWV